MESHHLPQNRKETKRVNQNIPPHFSLEKPTIATSLRDNSTKSTDPVTLMLASHQTIDSYSDDWIHVYTDGSAFKGTTKAGYGILIQYPDGSSSEISAACGEKCSNYDAEMMAIETALYHLTHTAWLPPPGNILWYQPGDAVDSRTLKHTWK